MTRSEVFDFFVTNWDRLLAISHKRFKDRQVAKDKLIEVYCDLASGNDLRYLNSGLIGKRLDWALSAKIRERRNDPEQQESMDLFIDHSVRAPDKIAAENELLEQGERARDQLPHRERFALEGKVEGRSNRQIAEDLGCGERAVSNYVRNGRAKIMKAVPSLAAPLILLLGALRAMTRRGTVPVVAVVGTVAVVCWIAFSSSDDNVAAADGGSFTPTNRADSSSVDVERVEVARSQGDSSASRSTKATDRPRLTIVHVRPVATGVVIGPSPDVPMPVLELNVKAGPDWSVIGVINGETTLQLDRARLRRLLTTIPGHVGGHWWRPRALTHEPGFLEATLVQAHFQASTGDVIANVRLNAPEGRSHTLLLRLHSLTGAILDELVLPDAQFETNQPTLREISTAEGSFVLIGGQMLLPEIDPERSFAVALCLDSNLDVFQVTRINRKWSSRPGNVEVTGILTDPGDAGGLMLTTSEGVSYRVAAQDGLPGQEVLRIDFGDTFPGPQAGQGIAAPPGAVSLHRNPVGLPKVPSVTRGPRSVPMPGESIGHFVPLEGQWAADQVVLDEDGLPAFVILGSSVGELIVFDLLTAQATTLLEPASQWLDALANGYKFHRIHAVLRDGELLVAGATSAGFGLSHVVAFSVRREGDGLTFEQTVRGSNRGVPVALLFTGDTLDVVFCCNAHSQHMAGEAYARCLRKFPLHSPMDVVLDDPADTGRTLVPGEVHRLVPALDWGLGDFGATELRITEQGLLELSIELPKCEARLVLKTTQQFGDLIHFPEVAGDAPVSKHDVDEYLCALHDAW